MDILKYLYEYADIATISAVLTFLTILLTFYNQVAVPMYNVTIKPFLGFMDSIYESPTRMKHLDAKLDEIIKELKPNGGFSIKDQLNRLEASVSLGQAERNLLLNTLDKGIWTSDKTGACVWANETLIKAVNGSLNDFINNNWENIIYPSDRDVVAKEWRKAIEQKRDFNLFYRLYNLKDNTPVNVHAIASPAYNFNKEVIGWNGIIYFT